MNCVALAKHAIARTLVEGLFDRGDLTAVTLVEDVYLKVPKPSLKR